MDTLKQGDKGQVKVLQKLLSGIAVDGSFGDKTKAAVEAYQTKNKLAVDGIVGRKPGISYWGADNPIQR